MKTSRVILLLAALAVFPSAASFASESYYIELGGGSPTDADTQWAALSEKYPSELKSLNHYPKAVLHHGKRVSTSVLAGPLNDKDKAGKICKTLFADNTPCFVIEGLDHPPVAVPATQAALPWLDNSSAAALSDPLPEPTVMPRRGLLSWLRGDTSPALEKTPPVDTAPPPNATPASDNKGKVEVAEAIPVPLTQPENIIDVPLQVKALPEQPRRRAVRRAPVYDGPGRLNISGFTDGDKAEAFWQDLREQQPQKSAGLRVRIVRPVAGGEAAGASLSIGPFAGHGDADTFCHTLVTTKDNGLDCHFELGDMPADAQKVAVASHFEHADAYAERRKIIMLHRNDKAEDDSQGAWTRTLAHPGKTYWVQILAADTEVAALDQWEVIRTNNSDLLDGMRSSVSTSVGARTSYVVRVGPIEHNSDALGLCKNLRERDVLCSVMISSGQ